MRCSACQGTGYTFKQGSGICMIHGPSGGASHHSADCAVLQNMARQKRVEMGLTGDEGNTQCATSYALLWFCCVDGARARRP